MIVPMKKITLIVLDRERDPALTALRKAGVLHVEKREAHGESISALTAELDRIDQAIALLSEVKLPKKTDMRKAESDESREIVKASLTLRDEKRAALEKAVSLNREMERLAPWGSVNPADFDYLAKKGLYLFPFEMSLDDFSTLPESVNTVVLSKDKKTVRCVVWGPDDLLHEGMPSSAKELALPSESTQTMKDELERLRALLPAIDEQLASYALYLSSVRDFRDEIAAVLEFETIRAGMEGISITENTPHSGGMNLAYLCGYVPEQRENTLRLLAAEQGWGFLSAVPSEEDAVPTQLKNNRFVNLISPLMDFLGTVPGYRELDISLWFLLFFGIFFAMIFGDAGYGLILVVISALGMLSFKSKGKSIPVGLSMFMYLGLMTVAWGTVTCSWFGIDPSVLPALLRDFSVWEFSNANPETEAVKQNIQVFCFTLGLVQVSLAHVIGVVRNIKSPKLLGELGALAMTIGMYFVVLNLVVDPVAYPMSPLVLSLVGGGFALNFIFINYSGSVIGGILESLKNIITMSLGVVNMFGDIMSYIRLWAVGLAGSAISVTINEMAGPFLGSFLIFAGVLVLLFGHGLNYVMSVLSVIVHGVRLNTLEFSNHLGLTWSGFKYEPFAETVKK